VPERWVNNGGIEFCAIYLKVNFVSDDGLGNFQKEVMVVVLLMLGTVLMLSDRTGARGSIHS
jgi:hypothetical protein